jgi:hypothetical protein
MSARARVVSRFICAFAIAGGVGGLTVAAQKDPLIGTWVLNVAKSTYAAGQAPKSQTVTFEADGQATRMISVSVNANGQTTRREYTAKEDGKDYPFKGSTASDTVSLRRIDALTTERTDKKDGAVVSVLVRTVSVDGKTFSVASRRPNGQATGNVSVYERTK